MSDKTEEYQTLDYVDVQTGSFISKPEDKPARHRKKQFSFRNFKEDLKTFIPHPAEHVEKMQKPLQRIPRERTIRSRKILSPLIDEK